MRFVRALPLLVLLVAGVFWLWTGVYEVLPDEEAIVLRLGRYDRTVGPGPHVFLPGLERKEQRRVTIVLREEFGYRTVALGPPPTIEDHPEEQRMLTSDVNLVDVDFLVQYRISNLRDYLLELRGDHAREVIRDAARSVVRAVVASHTIDQVLTQRGTINDESRLRLQKVLDGYKSGLHVQSVELQDVASPGPVREAFAEVETAAQDRERAILAAQGYADQVVPEARGRAEELLNQARAYREKRVLDASGEAGRFSALLVEYERAPEVTRERLYLEALEVFLPKVDKVIVDPKASDGVLPYLPLLRREKAK